LRLSPSCILPRMTGGGDKRFAGVPTAKLIVNLLPCA
jgi:hypothetical protein